MMYRLKVFAVFCIIGPALEWVYGKLWSIIGVSPWSYPNSPFEFTSFEGIPLWGLGGVLAAAIIQAIQKNSAKPLVAFVPTSILAVAWILVYSWFIQRGL